MINRRQIDTLDTLEICEEGNKQGPIIVLFHGYGASANDLFPIHTKLPSPAGTSWYFPNGFEKVPIAPHIYGRAWFPIDIEALERARQQGTYRNLSEDLPKNFLEAYKRAKNFLMALLEERQGIPNQLFIGGFSQGAMLATRLALDLDWDIGKLILLSGTLLDKKEWKKLIQDKTKFSFFQSHGLEDPILPFSLAEELYQLLKEGGHTGKLFQFSGGHEIPENILEELGAYLLS